MILTAVLVHGVIFGYFYLGGQIFIDRKAPATLRAQGQGFIFFTTFGVGMLIGNFVNSEIIRFFSHNTGGKLVYQWENIFLTTTVLSFICLLSFMLLFKNEDYKALTDIK